MKKIRRAMLLIILITIFSALPALVKLLIAMPLAGGLLIDWDDYCYTTKYGKVEVD